MSPKRQAYYEYEAVLLAVREGITKGEKRTDIIIRWATHYGRQVGLSIEKAIELLDVTPRQLLKTTLSKQGEK